MFFLSPQADVGLTATINAMDAANAVAVEWGLGANTPGILDEVRKRPSSSPLPPDRLSPSQNVKDLRYGRSAPKLLM